MISRIKITMLAGAAALATAAVGTGIAFGSSAHSSAAPLPTPASFGSSVTTPGSQGMSAWPGSGCWHGGMRGSGRLHRIEHGEATLQTAQGSEVVDLQRGSVQSVSAGQLSVRSADGFSASYAVNDSTWVRDRGCRSDITKVMTHDYVIVLATKSGGTATATRIIDIGQYGTTNR